MRIPEHARTVLESDAFGHLVTINPDGSPQVSVIWVGLDGDEIVAAHVPNNQKVKNIRRDGRVVLSVETDRMNEMGLTEYLVITGTARITEGGAVDVLRSWRRRTSGRRRTSCPVTTCRRGTSPTSLSTASAASDLGVEWMKIGVMLPVGGTDGPAGGCPSWADVRGIRGARRIRPGLDSVWLADHFFYRAPDGTTYGMHEAWTLLSAVAAVTERVELGTMVLCASFRDPGLTAKMAATLDHVSDGRLILGVGAGWHDPEYEAFGLPTDHRVGRFEEWLEIVARLVRGETVTFDGTYSPGRRGRARAAAGPADPDPGRRAPARGCCDLTAEWADCLEHRLVRRRERQVEERLGDPARRGEDRGPAGRCGEFDGRDHRP